MRRSVRNYASVGRWFFRSRFFAVVPTLPDTDGVPPARSAVSPIGSFYPASRRYPSPMPKRVDVKTALCWTGATQRRGFHDALEEHQEVDDDFMRKKYRPLKHTGDYIRAMQRLIRDRSYSRILDLFEKMKSGGVPMALTVYVSVMKAYSRMSNVDMVKQVFDEALTSGLKLEEFLFNTLIYAYTNTGDVHAAFEILDQMQKDYKIPPDHATYRALINVCNKGKDVDRAKETFDEMVQKFGGNARDFNAMLEVYAENADSDTGEAYLEECKKLMASTKSKEMSHKAFVYAPLIKLSGKLGRLDEALGYLKESVSSDVEPTLESFDFVFRSLTDLELTEEELETHLVYCLDRMMELKMKPTFVTFRTIAQIYEKKGDVGKALGFLAKLPGKHIRDAGSNGEIFAAQLEIVQRLWENGTYSQDEALTKLSEVVKTMKTLQVSLSFHGYRTWFIMCLKASDVERALECWNDFTGQGRWTSSGMAQSMLRLLLDHDRLDDAVQVMKIAVQKEKEITNKEALYETVLTYCVEKSDMENAKMVYDYMKEEKVEANEAIQKHLSALQLM